METDTLPSASTERDRTSIMPDRGQGVGAPATTTGMTRSVMVVLRSVWTGEPARLFGSTREVSVSDVPFSVCFDDPRPVRSSVCWPSTVVVVASGAQVPETEFSRWRPVVVVSPNADCLAPPAPSSVKRWLSVRPAAVSGAQTKYCDVASKGQRPGSIAGETTPTPLNQASTNSSEGLSTSASAASRVDGG